MWDEFMPFALGTSQKKCKLTHLIGKHVACNLVGNNVGIICEDAVQNRAVILSWNVMKRKKQAEQQSHSCSAATGFSRSQQVPHVMRSHIFHLI